MLRECADIKSGSPWTDEGAVEDGGDGKSPVIAGTLEKPGEPSEAGPWLHPEQAVLS